MCQFDLRNINAPPVRITDGALVHFCGYQDMMLKATVI